MIVTIILCSQISLAGACFEPRKVAKEFSVWTEQPCLQLVPETWKLFIRACNKSKPGENT